MFRLQNLIQKASDSTFYTWILNRVISQAVPFNAPHHFRITKIHPGETHILLPYRRSNRNHVKGIHACALATLCEFTVGMTLISKISDSQYRLILKNLKMEYHYQAKMDVTASFTITEETLKNKIIDPLLNSDAIFHEFEIKVTDVAQNLICTGHVNWQIKKWDKVGK